MTMDDATLLREYAAGRSEGAFTQLVKRHVDLVHSVAFRFTRNRVTAEDITQTVFILLARKADRLVDHPCLGAWLHRTTTHLSLRRRRSEQRRQLREALAVAYVASDMKASPDHEPILERLDEALERLGKLDRTAIISRFFFEKSMKEVGDALGTTEAAAKMRVGRALERLRIELIRRGASCSPAGLAAVLHSSSITPAPSHLAGTIAQHLATGSAASVVPSSSILSFLLMSSLKSKTLVGTVIVLALLGGARFWPIPESESPDDPRSVQSPATLPSPSAENVSAGASPAVGGQRLSQPLTEADLALARQQLRDALSLPVPKSGITWPEPRVLEALERFRNRSDAAFAVLREVIDEMSSISDGLKATIHASGSGCAMP
jgi:RNA polymerase sigma factor (sigma-70 family)